MTLPLRVSVTPERADASPGDALTFDVTVRNASDIVEHYGVEFLGLPDGAQVRTEPDVAKLRPSESGTLTVRITLPVQPPAPAGTYVLGALVRSKYRHDVSRCVEVPVQLASIESIAVKAIPEVVTGGRAGRYTVEVSNGGNAPVRLYLAATDPERRVIATFEPGWVDLPPGTSAQALLTVQAPLPWNREKQRALTITATPDLPGATPGTGNASFVQKPRFASKFAKFAGIAAGVLVLAAAVAVPALLMARNAKDDPPQNPAAATAPVVVPPTVPVQPSAAAQPSQAPPSAAPSEAASSPAAEEEQPPGAQAPRRVDLTKPKDGVLASDTFRDQGFLSSADPGSISVPGCENATATAVVTDADQKRFLTSANPDDATKCHSVPVLLDFLQGAPAGGLTVVPLTKDTLEMEVGYTDLSRTTEPSLAVPEDKAKARGGIDFVLVRPRSQDGAATPPVALTELVITPLR
ncbi:hypothetical protein [Actinoplanes sp. NBRC 103695]|uniref:COG1470 family protein n=1 Tax=Actinoplanes sp. NBRC 103695 TaxID=3032202 RepID=UPI0024A2CC49|nr:hypothetical protein [Actinoplanes sp. NBRC 103695]GLZ00384.1 hypothetical protein Acsp02_76360 [Actinoplanes sp. NBRC 103695]